MEAAYHYSYSFADAFAPEIVNRLAGRTVPSRNLWRPPTELETRFTMLKRMAPYARALKSRVSPLPQRLISLGSVFQFARHGDAVWGTGINPHYQKKLARNTSIDIRSVRGPLTRQYIMEELNLPCPEKYGDPGIAFPSLFPEFKKSATPKHEYLVICQHVDELYVRRHKDRFENYNIYLCQRPDPVPWQDVIKEILDAKFIIASSLHAIILAEAFGIPARWWYNDLLPSYYKTGQFKYNDYFLSTGRTAGSYARSIDEALDLGGRELPSVDLTDQIKEAFPSDLFE